MPLFRLFCLFSSFIIFTLCAGYVIYTIMFFGVIDPVGVIATLSSACLLLWQAITYKEEPHEIQDR